MMKKAFSFVFALAVLVSLVPVGQTGATGFDFSKHKVPVIANRYRTISKSYVPKLVKVPGTHFLLEGDTLTACELMLKDAREEGHKKLRVQSAYRSYETQRVLHNNKIEKYKPKYGNRAAEMAAMVVARPGQSEHQLGNTVDLTVNGSLSQSFAKTSAGVWLAENAHRYGFILRYPEGKTDITGVIFEPWHFRYVGAEIAGYIYENGLTLEEYVETAMNFFMAAR